jgi:hypothetical protein
MLAYFLLLVEGIIHLCWFHTHCDRRAAVVDQNNSDYELIRMNEPLREPSRPEEE